MKKFALILATILAPPGLAHAQCAGAAAYDPGSGSFMPPASVNGADLNCLVSNLPKTLLPLTGGEIGGDVTVRGTLRLLGPKEELGANGTVQWPNVMSASTSGILLAQRATTVQPIVFGTGNVIFNGGAPAVASASASIQSNNTYTGTANSGDPSVLFSHVRANDRVTSSGTGPVYGALVEINVDDAAEKGPVVAHAAMINVTHASGNTAGGAIYNAGTFQAAATVSDNGTTSAAKSSVNGINNLAVLRTGATNWAGLGAEENDCAVEAGASADDFVCEQIVLYGSHRVRGRRDDVLLSLNSQGGSAATATNGIEFGRNGGSWPFGSDSTLINATGPGASGAQPAQNGIDFTKVAFTGSAFKSAGASIDGHGNIAANTYKVSKGTTIASASTISPVAGLTHVTGTAAIQSISLPYQGFVGCIDLIPDGVWKTATGGNIAKASTAIVNRVLRECFDGSAWYPDY